MKEIQINNLDETIALANLISKYIFEGMVITLEGDLGAGKTTFTKALGKAMGIKKVINSPTFTILKSYKGDMNLHHIDAYRLEHASQDLGFEELYEDGLTIIEWPIYMKDWLPEEYLKISIKWIDENKRVFMIEGFGEAYKKIEEMM